MSAREKLQQLTLNVLLLGETKWYKILAQIFTSQAKLPNHIISSPTASTTIQFDNTVADNFILLFYFILCQFCAL